MTSFSRDWKELLSAAITSNPKTAQYCNAMHRYLAFDSMQRAKLRLPTDVTPLMDKHGRGSFLLPVSLLGESVSSLKYDLQPASSSVSLPANGLYDKKQAALKSPRALNNDARSDTLLQSFRPTPASSTVKNL